MSQKIKSVFLAGLPAIVIATLLVVAIIYAWTEPTSAPPAGNVSAPINAGPIGQSKQGNLMLNTDGTLANGLLVPYGNVGIGTTTPTTGKLVVSGGNVDVSGNKVINLVAPTASGDAATKGYVDSKISTSTYTLCRGVCGGNDVGCAGDETRVDLLSNGSGCQTTPAFFNPSLGTGTVVFEVKTSSTGCYQCGDFYPNRCRYDYETLYFNNQPVATSILCFSAESSTLNCPGTDQPSSCAVCCK